MCLLKGSLSFYFASAACFACLCIYLVGAHLDVKPINANLFIHSIAINLVEYDAKFFGQPRSIVCRESFSQSASRLKEHKLVSSVTKCLTSEFYF